MATNMASSKFRFPALIALVLSEGTAHRQEIFKLIEKLASIAPEDHRDWTITASHQLSGLRDLGYVEQVGEGKWRITDNGRRHYYARLGEIALREYEEYNSWVEANRAATEQE
jgi:predicted transcriptional regulator